MDKAGVRTSREFAETSLCSEEGAVSVRVTDCSKAGPCCWLLAAALPSARQVNGAGACSVLMCVSSFVLIHRCVTRAGQTDSHPNLCETTYPGSCMEAVWKRTFSNSREGSERWIPRDSPLACLISSVSSLRDAVGTEGDNGSFLCSGLDNNSHFLMTSFWPLRAQMQYDFVS